LRAYDSQIVIQSCMERHAFASQIVTLMDEPSWKPKKKSM
jgi:hypothetical protein